MRSADEINLVVLQLRKLCSLFLFDNEPAVYLALCAILNYHSRNFFCNYTMFRELKRAGTTIFWCWSSGVFRNASGTAWGGLSCCYNQAADVGSCSDRVLTPVGESTSDERVQGESLDELGPKHLLGRSISNICSLKNPTYPAYPLDADTSCEVWPPTRKRRVQSS